MSAPDWRVIIDPGVLPHSYRQGLPAIAPKRCGQETFRRRSATGAAASWRCTRPATSPLRRLWCSRTTSPTVGPGRDGRGRPRPATHAGWAGTPAACRPTRPGAPPARGPETGPGRGRGDPPVDQHQLQPVRDALPRQVSQQQVTGPVLVGRGGYHQRSDGQPRHVDCDDPLRALRATERAAPIVEGRPPVRRAAREVGVDHHHRRSRLGPTLEGAGGRVQHGQRPRPRPVTRPAAELRPDPRPRAKRLRQVPPLTPGVRDVQHRVHHLSKVRPVLRTPLARASQHRPQKGPLLVGQVTGVRHGPHRACRRPRRSHRRSNGTHPVRLPGAAQGGARSGHDSASTVSTHGATCVRTVDAESSPPEAARPEPYAGARASGSGHRPLRRPRSRARRPRGWRRRRAGGPGRRCR